MRYCSTSTMVRPCVAQGGDALEELGDDERRQAHRELVEHHDARVADQGPAHGQHLLLAAGQRPGGLAEALGRAAGRWP